MEIRFSNGRDELNIRLPSRLPGAEEWFDAPVRLRVGELSFGYSGSFQTRDFRDLFRRAEAAGAAGSEWRFDCLEGHLEFTVSKHDSLGHFRLDVRIEQPPTVIMTAFVLDSIDLERVLTP